MLLKIIWQAVVLAYFVVHAFKDRKPPKQNPDKSQGDWEWPEKLHSPNRFRPHISPYVNDSWYRINEDTPDYRFEEDPAWPMSDKRIEDNRPFRLNPFVLQIPWFHTKLHANHWGCYCCTVFKRLTPLAACAVITTRHILTTASSTELVLKEYGKKRTLENILGAWYDFKQEWHNTSQYLSVSRIHYHPRFLMPDTVNASHPIPCINDLAVWATTIPIYGKSSGHSWEHGAYICNRAGSNGRGGGLGSPIPYVDCSGMRLMIIGFQYMWGYQRVPSPFHKYVIKTNLYQEVCPKNEWGWFFCLSGRVLPLGMDSGCIMHRSNREYAETFDGLLAMGAFSSTLRANHMTHYFTPLENYDVLEWLYKAYMSRLSYRWLDARYYDTKDKAPNPKPWYYIPWIYPEPESRNYDAEPTFW